MDKISIDDIPKEVIDVDYISSFYKKWEFDLDFVFKSDFTNAKYLRWSILFILEVLGLNTVWKNRFVLIVDELNNNSIEYWSNKEDTNSMRVSTKKDSEDIIINIEVEDSWKWPNAKKAQEMEDLRNQKLSVWFDKHKSIRWRWLFLIITKLVDELYFKDSDKWWLIVWVKKRLKSWIDF